MDASVVPPDAVMHEHRCRRATRSAIIAMQLAREATSLRCPWRSTCSGERCSRAPIECDSPTGTTPGLQGRTQRCFGERHGSRRKLGSRGETCAELDLGCDARARASRRHGRGDPRGDRVRSYDGGLYGLRAAYERVARHPRERRSRGASRPRALDGPYRARRRRLRARFRGSRRHAGPFARVGHPVERVDSRDARRSCARYLAGGLPLGAQARRTSARNRRSHRGRVTGLAGRFGRADGHA
jgi:hypothetical protein